MRRLITALALAAGLGAFGAAHVLAADEANGDADAKGEAASKADKKDDKPDLPPFPAEASVKQTTHVGGRTLNYTASVGALPVRDDKGKTIAQVVVTAYTLDGPRDPARLRLQRRPRRRVGLSEPRRHRPQAGAIRGGGRQSLRSGAPDRQRRNLARLH